MTRSVLGALAASALIIAAALPADAVEKGGRIHPETIEGVVNRGAADAVALTFDACPRPTGVESYDAAIIDVLRKEKVPATLFISGQWALKHPDIVKDLAADPLFEIAAHGHRHANMRGQSEAASRAELAKAQAVLTRITGKAPGMWRPPYGEVDTAAVAAATSLGLRTVNFSLSSGDPDKRISAKRLVRGVVENARKGSIVVMHMNGNGVHTAEALPAMIAGLRKRGFSFVKVSEFLPAGNPARKTAAKKVAHARPR